MFLGFKNIPKNVKNPLSLLGSGQIFSVSGEWKFTDGMADMFSEVLLSGDYQMFGVNNGKFFERFVNEAESGQLSPEIQKADEFLSEV